MVMSVITFSSKIVTVNAGFMSRLKSNINIQYEIVPWNPIVRKGARWKIAL